MMIKEYAAQLRAMGAGYVPKYHGRHVPVVFSFLLQNVDYSTASGATWEGDVRLIPDSGGSVVGAFTITAEVQGDDTLVTFAMAAPASIVGFPNARSTGETAQLFYDIHLTPSGGTRQVFIGGDFNVVAGVVQDFMGYIDPPVADVSDYIRTLLDDSDAATARTTLGLAAVASSGAASDLATDMTTYMPTIRPTVGAFTTVTVLDAAYTKVGKAVFVALRFVLTGIGTGSGVLEVTMPSNAAYASTQLVEEYATVGRIDRGNLSAGSDILSIKQIAGASVIAMGAGFRFTGYYLET